MRTRCATWMASKHSPLLVPYFSQKLYFFKVCLVIFLLYFLMWCTFFNTLSIPFALFILLPKFNCFLPKFYYCSSDYSLLLKPCLLMNIFRFLVYVVRVFRLLSCHLCTVVYSTYSTFFQRLPSKVIQLFNTVLKTFSPIFYAVFKYVYIFTIVKLFLSCILHLSFSLSLHILLLLALSLSPYPTSFSPSLSL